MTVIRVVDTETCGLPPDNAQVCEVAYVDLWQPAGAPSAPWQRDRMWSSLVNPGRPIPPEASAVHHITDEMVKDAPTLEAVRATLMGPGDHGVPDYYAAHEAKFEKASLPFLADRLLLCSRKVAATFWPDAPNHKNQTMRYYLGLKLADPSLAQPHRAMGDCYVSAALVRRMLGQKLTDDTVASVELLLEISASPVFLARLPFGQHAMKPCAEIPESYWEWIVKNIKDDEDVLYTANCYLASKREARRSRSPV